MWPWDHLAFGYLIYSSSRRVHNSPPPDRLAIALLVVATQLPDLIDKPLAWSLGVLPSGLSLGHSLLFATVLLLGVGILGARWGRSALAYPFGVGYLSHLLGDGLYPAILGDDLSYRFLLWPFVPTHPEPVTGFFPRTTMLLSEFTAFIATPRGQLFVVVELLMLTAAMALWILDGAPWAEGLGRGSR